MVKKVFSGPTTVLAIGLIVCRHRGIRHVLLKPRKILGHQISQSTCRCFSIFRKNAAQPVAAGKGFNARVGAGPRKIFPG